MKQLNDYRITFTSKELSEQVKEFLTYYEQTEVAKHSIEVAEEAKRLAAQFGVSEEKAYIAGLLHDISVVIPNEERIQLQRELGEVVLAEEEVLPMILHQKQSVYLAKTLFATHDESILSAVECHTTLRGEASDLDKVVFIADKVKWDRKNSAPYLEDLNKALTHSLEDGCCTYIEWTMSEIVVLHPWLKAAMTDLGIKRK